MLLLSDIHLYLTVTSKGIFGHFSPKHCFHFLSSWLDYLLSWSYHKIVRKCLGRGWSGGIQSLPSKKVLATEASETAGYGEDSWKSSAEWREKFFHFLSSPCAGLFRERTISDGWVKEKTQVLQQLCAILRIFYLESIYHYHIHHIQAFKAPKLGSHPDGSIGQAFLFSSWIVQTPSCPRRWIKAG